MRLWSGRAAQGGKLAGACGTHVISAGDPLLIREAQHSKIAFIAPPAAQGTHPNDVDAGGVDHTKENVAYEEGGAHPVLVSSSEVLGNERVLADSSDDDAFDGGECCNCGRSPWHVIACEVVAEGVASN